MEHMTDHDNLCMRDILTLYCQCDQSLTEPFSVLQWMLLATFSEASSMMTIKLFDLYRMLQKLSGYWGAINLSSQLQSMFVMSIMTDGHFTIHWRLDCCIPGQDCCCCRDLDLYREQEPLSSSWPMTIELRVANERCSSCG